MKKVKAHIESNGQGFYSIYTKEDLPIFLIGDGYSVEEAKADFLAVYQASRKEHKRRTGQELSYSFTFVMDMSALLANYKSTLSLAGLADLTGINKAQLSQYACGTRNPSPKTQKKIKEAVRAFADELSHAFA